MNKDFVWNQTTNSTEEEDFCNSAERVKMYYHRKGWKVIKVGTYKRKTKL